MTDGMLDFTISLARDAGEMLSGRFADFRAQKVDYKGRRDLVTQADTDLENFIVSRIRKEFPGHDILAEESQSRESGSDYRWIIDPLDGTTNFVHGHPFVSVSIALMFRGEIQLGAVAAPMLGAIFSAERGYGAKRNAVPINVSEVEDLLHAMVATGFAYNRNESEANNIENFASIVTEVQGIRRCGSAAIDLCFVAAGVYDAFWELWLAPWDVAAGSIIVQEAGGVVTDFDGKDDFIFSGNLVASNGRLHETVRPRLKGADIARREIESETG